MSNFLDFATPLDSPFAGDAGSSCSVTSGHCPPGTIERVTCWPMKEVPNNLDMTTGMLGLTDKEEDQIVAFLETLTDGFTAPYPYAIRSRDVSSSVSSVSQNLILKQEELMDVQKINAVGTEYGGMLRAVLAGDPETLGRPCTSGVH